MVAMTLGHLMNYSLADCFCFPWLSPKNLPTRNQVVFIVPKNRNKHQPENQFYPRKYSYHTWWFIPRIV